MCSAWLIRRFPALESRWRTWSAEETSIAHRRPPAAGPGPARPTAALHRAAALVPPPGEYCQPLVAVHAVGEPGRLDQGLGDRVQHRRGVARLVRIDRDQHLVAHMSL